MPLELHNKIQHIMLIEIVALCDIAMLCDIAQNVKNKIAYFYMPI